MYKNPERDEVEESGKDEGGKSEELEILDNSRQYKQLGDIVLILQI